MKISLIAAIGKNNELGKDNNLLWRSKSELNHFKTITNNHCLIMGRKTFESLPGILPNRHHIVISSKVKANVDNVSWVSSIEDAIDLINMSTVLNKDEVFIIGGGQIYKKVLECDIVTDMYISHMDWEGEADTYFPKIDKEKWVMSQIVKVIRCDNTDLNWVANHYRRKVI